MTSQRGKQTISIHLFSNMSGNRGNQTMKFDQLIEYNMRNVFLEKWNPTLQKLVPDPFLKNQNWGYLWDLKSKVLQSLFLLYANLRAIEIYWN